MRNSVGEVKIKPQPVENLIKLRAGNGRGVGAQHLHEMGAGLAQCVSLPRRGAQRIVRDLRAEALFKIFHRLLIFSFFRQFSYFFKISFRKFFLRLFRIP